MTCFHCGVTMRSGEAKFFVYGRRTVLAHVVCDRAPLMAQAKELGCLGDDEQLNDQQLIDRISAEVLAGEWLDRMEKLPTDEAKADAVHRLRLDVEKQRGGR